MSCFFRERANDVHFDIRFGSHLQPLAATCSGSHLQPLVTSASGCKWLPEQVSASDCKCLPEQVSASDCPVNDRPQLHNMIASSREVASREAHPRVAARDECRSICPVALHCFFPAALPPSVGSVSQERQGTALCPHFTAGCFSGPAFVRWRLKEHSSLLQEALALQYIGVN